MSILKILYRCHFCRIDLRAIPFKYLKPHAKLFALLGIRVYRCPHCFDCVYRPHLPSGWTQTPRGGRPKPKADVEKTSETNKPSPPSSAVSVDSGFLTKTTAPTGH